MQQNILLCCLSFDLGQLMDAPKVALFSWCWFYCLLLMLLAVTVTLLVLVLVLLVVRLISNLPISLPPNSNFYTHSTLHSKNKLMAPHVGTQWKTI